MTGWLPDPNAPRHGWDRVYNGRPDPLRDPAEDRDRRPREQWPAPNFEHPEVPQ